ncbi:enoyl-CoA hydratase [Verticiella sediminum]|uniref:Enoyl-CoA hydratase n=1 Tax=Verticiella sediminum TaxID=1247510 RepID=A0A556AWI9_9BURK|nr:enoyl-CoA hydratase [Verticiella sediminum]TSH97309.1 enoyl-CoA hydratase [Verticiella sediminum]
MTTATPPSVHGTVADGIATLTIDNPRRLNAMTLGMWDQLHRLVRDYGEREDVRVLVLRGAGERAFVSGADISEFGEQRDSPEQVARYGAAVHAAQASLSQCAKPVVAAIRGICIGGGIGLALACDLRYASASTRFRMPAARLGLGYDLRSTRRMVEMLGAPRAVELFFTARMFDGTEAERCGVVHRSFADEIFEDELAGIVAGIAGNAPLTLRAAKLAVRHILAEPDAPDAASVEAAVQACFDSEDYREGQQAFQDKRPPRFRGR